jgi:hypothetical protein
MISAQTLRVCREGKPVSIFPDHALEKLLSMKFGWRLIPMWPFSETNAAAMRAKARRFTSAGFRGRNLFAARQFYDDSGGTGKPAVAYRAARSNARGGFMR